MQPVDRDNYIDESTFTDGDYSFYDYCANIGDDERIGGIRDLLEYALPKGMFELTSEDTLLYKGGVERWKEEYVANVRRKAETLTVKICWDGVHLLSQTGDKQLVGHRLLFLSRRGDLPILCRTLLCFYGVCLLLRTGHYALHRGGVDYNC